MPSVNTMITGLAFTALSLLQICSGAPAAQAPAAKLPAKTPVKAPTPTLPVNGGKFFFKRSLKNHPLINLRCSRTPGPNHCPGTSSHWPRNTKLYLHRCGSGSCCHWSNCNSLRRHRACLIQPSCSECPHCLLCYDSTGEKQLLRAPSQCEALQIRNSLLHG